MSTAAFTKAPSAELSIGERLGRRLGVLAVTALVFGITLLRFPASNTKSTADFSEFYCAAQIVRQGLGHDLYNLAVQAAFQSKVGALHVFYFRLPYEALWFIPFTAFSYHTAYVIWTIVCICLLARVAWWIETGWSIVGKFSRLVRVPSDAGLIFILFLTFAPVTTCLLLGQTAIVMLFIYTGVFVLMDRGSDFSAGCLLALGLCKFQLVLPFAAILLLRRKWSFVKGFSCVGALLMLVSLGIAGFGFPRNYLRLLFLDSRHLPVGGFNPMFMPNLRGLVNLFIDHRVSPIILTGVVLALSLLCLGAVAKAFNDQRLMMSLSAALLATLLVSYSLFNYDLTLTLLPLSLMAAEFPAETGGLRNARMFQLACLILFVPPLHRTLLLHTLYPLMVIPVILLFFHAIEQARLSLPRLRPA